MRAKSVVHGFGSVPEYIENLATGLPASDGGAATVGCIEVVAQYQTDSAHYQPVYPKVGGADNQCGHMLTN